MRPSPVAPRAVSTFGLRQMPATRIPACDGTRMRLLRRLHEKISFGQNLQDYQDYEDSKTPAHCENLVNPVNPVKKRRTLGIGVAIGSFVDIRVGRSPVRVAGLAENRRLEWRGGV